MDFEIIKPLVNFYHRILSRTNTQFKRYLYGEINWDVRMVGIKGARGVGKTTLLLQRIKESFERVDDAFYVSLDELWFDRNSLEDLVEYLYTHGVTHLFFDEVHRCKNWTRYLKNFYDNYPDLYIVYTGSAMLAIDNSKSDLSRRQSLYTLHGMSFREYLEYENGVQIHPLTLNALLDSHVKYAMEVASKIRVLKYFDEYLQKGYYPFYKESDIDYYMRLGEVARLIIESDIPSVEDITFSTLEKVKKLLMVIAPNVPLVPNINKLSVQLETTRDQCLKMLNILEKAGLLLLFHDRPKDYKHLTNPKKIYMNNSNLMYALSSTVSEGNVRETFFANQMGVVSNLTIPREGDFLADGKYLFEVGGSSKTYKQIADIPDSYLAVDDLEMGTGSRLPLWIFGCLY